MKWNESRMLGDSVFGCQGFCCPFIFDYKNALPWHDASFPICHYSHHAPLPLALYFRICPWARQGTLENNTPGKLCSQVCFSQSAKASAMLAGCLFTFYTLWARNNCGSRRAHLAFRSVIWIRGNALPLLQLNTIAHSRCESISKIHFSLQKLPKRCSRYPKCIILAAARTARTLRQMSSLHFLWININTAWHLWDGVTLRYAQQAEGMLANIVSEGKTILQVQFLR